MGRFGSSRFVRVEVEPQVSDLPATNVEDTTRLNDKIDNAQITEQRSKKANALRKGKSFKARVLSRVFSEDYDTTKNKILDPKGKTIQKWNKVFLVASLISVFLDPLFFYLPIVSGNICIEISGTLRIILTILRSVTDIFYVIQIVIKFHTAYAAPSSRVLGRGELVIDPKKIASRYLCSSFFIDLLFALPIPQVLVWFIVPKLDGWAVMHIKNFIWFIIMLQFFPKVIFAFLLQSQITEVAGVVSRSAWTGATFNLMLYLFASHVFGACYYLLSLERQEDCWHFFCNLETSYCPDTFFDCRHIADPNRTDWFQSTNVTNNCNANNFTAYPFGIYSFVAQFNVQSVAFMNKYLFCLWWGVKNLSTIGQNLIPSIYVGENIFNTIVGVWGLVLLSLLIGNVQRIGQSTTKRLEVWKIKRADAEQWMHQRHLPQELRHSVRKYDRYKWIATKGVDEEALIRSLPAYLSRKVKRHLCFDLVRKVPLFDQMDESMLDAICERLKPAWCTTDLCLVRKGDPVKQMLFICRGNLDSYTVDGLVNSCRLGPGDFCGEELVLWALDPRPSVTLPSSTHTVKAIDEVEAFALEAQDLKFVASQFWRPHSKQLRHKFRFYSQQWRTWAACTIQVAWHRHKKFKEEDRPREPGMPPPGSFWSVFAETLVASTRWTAKHRKSAGSNSGDEGSLEKPEEPDFSDNEEQMENTIKLISNVHRQ